MLSAVAALLLGVGIDPTPVVLARPGDDPALGLTIESFDVSGAMGRQVSAGFTADGSPWFVARARPIGTSDEQSGLYLVLPERRISVPFPPTVDDTGGVLTPLDLRLVDSSGAAVGFATRFDPDTTLSGQVSVFLRPGMPADIEPLQARIPNPSPWFGPFPSESLHALAPDLIAYPSVNSSLWYVKRLGSTDLARRLPMEQSSSVFTVQPSAVLPDEVILSGGPSVQIARLDDWSVICNIRGIFPFAVCGLAAEDPSRICEVLAGPWSVSAEGDLAAAFFSRGYLPFASGPFDEPQRITDFPPLWGNRFSGEVQVLARPAAAWTARVRATGEPARPEALAFRTLDGDLHIPLVSGDPSPDGTPDETIDILPAVYPGQHDQTLAVVRVEGPSFLSPPTDMAVFVDADASVTVLAREGDVYWPLSVDSPLEQIPTAMGTGDRMHRVSPDGRVILPLAAMDGTEAVFLFTAPDRSPCGPADIAPPFRLLTFDDVLSFIDGWNAEQMRSDLNRDGVYDAADIDAFVLGFLAGCG